MTTRLYKTVKPSGGDYTSLAACLADNQKNLVTADQYFDIEIDGVWEDPDTAQVTIQSPWVTDADHYINIYTTPQARHSGVWDTNKYRHVIPAAYNQYNIGVNIGYVFIDGILVYNPGTGSAGSYCIVYNNNIPFGRVKNCLVHGSPSTGIWMGATNGEVINCNAYDCGARGILLRGTNSKAYNCNAAYCAYGFRNYFQDSGPGGTFINCLARNSTYSDFYHEGSYPPTVTYCASSDATADDWGGSGNRINQTFSMVDPTGSPRNLHLASDDGGARNFGTDLSAYFTDDIDGQTRPGESVWDIGADEYMPAGTTKTVSEAGHGADALAIQALLAISESGHGADGLGSLGAAVPVSDVGTGSDIPKVTVQIAISDTGHGTDFVSVLTAILKTVSDAGGGADAPKISVSLTIPDTGHGADLSKISVTLIISDAGHGADAVSVLTALLKTVADTAHGSDSLVISVQVPVSDFGGGSDTIGLINVLLKIMESGHGFDSITITGAGVTKYITATFSGKKPGSTFGGKEPMAEFIGKKPGIDFEPIN